MTIKKLSILFPLILAFILVGNITASSPRKGDETSNLALTDSSKMVKIPILEFQEEEEKKEKEEKRGSMHQRMGTRTTGIDELIKLQKLLQPHPENKQKKIKRVVIKDPRFSTKLPSFDIKNFTVDSKELYENETKLKELKRMLENNDYGKEGDNIKEEEELVELENFWE